MTTRDAGLRFSIVSEQERVSDAQKKLTQLMNQGYEFIVTDPDGNRWIGSESREGLPIESVIGTQFRGEVLVQHQPRI